MRNREECETWLTEHDIPFQTLTYKTPENFTEALKEMKDMTNVHTGKFAGAHEAHCLFL